MTPGPLVLGPDATAIDAARAMRDINIGSVLVVDGDELVGIVTDRDIVLRVIAENVSPGLAMLSSISTPVDVVVAPEDPVGEVVRLMRDRAVRRGPRGPRGGGVGRGGRAGRGGGGPVAGGAPPGGFVSRGALPRARAPAWPPPNTGAAPPARL